MDFRIKKITVKNVDLDGWLNENKVQLHMTLKDIGEELLQEFGGAGKEGYDVQYWYGRKRPVVNIRAKGEAGFKEHTRGGPLTRIAAARKRLQGNPKV